MSELTVERIYEWLADVKDPEVPALSILDLGIVRNVTVNNNANGTSATVTITPTYSGCPAMDVISIGVRMALAGHGIKQIIVDQQLSPAWTTDWMTDDGKRKLKEYGIAPPNRKVFKELGLFEEEEVQCPRCESTHTTLVSQYGPTSCKALYKCEDCKEPFEHFKCH
jgi:ring-1,2-phenylacetyl-CoA epoxidase subunit PaaD